MDNVIDLGRLWLIAPLVDGVGLVVALGKTNKVNLKRTVDTLALCDVKLLGVVTRHPEGRKNDDATFGSDEPSLFWPIP